MTIVPAGYSTFKIEHGTVPRLDENHNITDEREDVVMLTHMLGFDIDRVFILMPDEARAIGEALIAP